MDLFKGRLTVSQTMCDALVEEEKRPQLHGDAQTFQLHMQFIRAHGVPRGELTMLAAGEVWSSGAGIQ